MKILHISHSLDLGGGPEYIYKIVVGLPKHKHIVAGNRGEYYYKFKNCNIDTISFNHINLIFNYIKIIRVIKKEKVDVVHGHGRGSIIYLVFLSMIKKKLNLIYTIHGFNINNMSYIKKSIYLMLERIVNKNIYKTIFVSESEKKYYEKVLKTKIYNYEIIPNFIEIINNKKQSIISFKESNKPINIIYAGRLSYEKGIDILIKALSLLKNEYKYNLSIIGDGKEYFNLYKLVIDLNLSDKIAFLGRINNLKEVLADYDLLVIPSRFEGMPFTLLEGMCVGIPIIATPARGIIDVVDKNSVYMASAITPEKLAEQLNYYFEDSIESIKKKVALSKYIYSQKYTPEKILPLINKIYEKS